MPASPWRRGRSPTRPTARSTPTRTNAILDLPRADRRPVRRQRAPGHRQARLVGDHGRPRPADRYRPLLRHLRQRARRLHGHDRAGLDRPGDGPALRPRLPGHHRPRHGARAGDAARPARHREPVLRRRRLDGRHAGAAMGGELSRARLRGHADRRRRPGIRRRTSPSTKSAARRSWPIPTGARGRYLEEGMRPAQGPRGGAHGRAHHLPLRDARCTASSAATCRTATRRPSVRRRLPDRELPAPPGPRPSSSASTPIPIST